MDTSNPTPIFPKGPAIGTVFCSIAIFVDFKSSMNYMMLDEQAPGKYLQLYLEGITRLEFYSMFYCSRDLGIVWVVGLESGL